MNAYTACGDYYTPENQKSTAHIVKNTLMQIQIWLESLFGIQGMEATLLLSPYNKLNYQHAGHIDLHAINWGQ